MRVTNFTLGLIFFAFIACGGESDVDNPNEGDEPEAGQGGDSGAPPPSGGGEAGSSEQPGAAGQGAVTGTGGTVGRGGGTTAGSPGTGAAGPTPPGMGGRGPVPPPPTAGAGPVPPEGCVLQGSQAAVGYCQSSYSCSNGYLEAYCKDDGAGNAYCQCNSNSVSQQFTLSGVPGLAACTAIAELCMGGGAEPSGDEVCTPSVTTEGATSCQRQELCTQALEGSDATITRNRGVYCQGSPVICSCDTGNQFRLDADSTDGACEKLIEHCDDPRVPGEGPVTCEPRMQGSGAGYCSVYEECLSETDIGDGITAVTISGRNTSCNTLTASQSVCSCSGSNVSVQFEIDASTDGLASCLAASEVCGDGGELNLDGEVTCAPSNQSAGATDCYATLDCTKEGSIGSQAVRVHGYLSVSCSGSGGAFNCSCGSNFEQEMLEVEADTSWDACSTAVEQCPSLVEPSFNSGSGAGGAGGAGPLPVPAPPPDR